MRADPTIAPRILITRSMLVARLLIIVSRAQPTQYTYLQHVFGRETGDVIVDRRARERRWRQKLVAVRERRGGPGQRDNTNGLPAVGLALLRRPAPPRGAPPPSW